MTDKAMEALNNLCTAMKGECGEGKWFPDWVPYPEYDGKFTRHHYMDAIEQVRTALTELAEIKERAEEVISQANREGYSSKQANYILKGGK